MSKAAAAPGSEESEKEEMTKSPPAGTRRQLDLDDFANSPAADADDAGSPEEGEVEECHDVEMRVALG